MCFLVMLNINGRICVDPPRIHLTLHLDTHTHPRRWPRSFRARWTCFCHRRPASTPFKT